MHYLQRDKFKKNKRRVILILVVVVVVGIAVWSPPQMLREFGILIARPFLRARVDAVAQVGSLGSIVHSKQQLLTENKKLVEEIRQLKIQNTERDTLKRENEELKALFDARLHDTKNILAGVLAGLGISPYDTLLVDVGSADGVVLGDSAIASGGLIIGSVDVVSEHTARIRLVSSPGSEYPVVLGNQGIELLARGRGGGSFELAVPRDVPVAVGDRIVTPGQHAQTVGLVERVDVSPTDPVQTVFFSVPVNFYTLRFIALTQ